MGLKVLITGANGFIGKALTKKIIARDDVEKIVLLNRKTEHSIYHENFKERVSEVKVDLRYIDIVHDLFNFFKPDIIFHLAGISKVAHEEDLIQTNIAGTYNLSFFAPEGCKIVFSSSLTIHPNFAFPVDEKSIISPESLYGVTKASSEYILNVAHKKGKILGRCLRLAAITGLGSTHGVIHDFINKLKSNSECLEILGEEPGSVKPFVHLDDCVNAFLLAGFDYHIGDFLVANVSQNNTISVKDIASIVIENYGINKPVKWLGANANWFGDNPRMEACNKKLKSLGWALKYPTCEEAITASVIENRINQSI
jgi:UDP-glucose 4-epimerase